MNAIVFKGEKAKKYKERITELLTIRENTSFVDNYLKQDINIIKAFYSHNGYYFAKVKLDKVENSNITIVYIKRITSIIKNAIININLTIIN